MRAAITSIVLLFAICAGACQPSAPSSGAARSATNEAVTPLAGAGNSPDQLPALPNLLICTYCAGARVEIRRMDSLTPVPVAFGAEVQPGDVLTLREGRAGVFCGAESDWEASPMPLSLGTAAGVPCGAGRPPRPYADAATVRGFDDKEGAQQTDAPFVLSPRSGWVLSDRPTLVWHEVTGVASYTVTLVSDDAISRVTLATASPMAFPVEWEPLQGDGAGYHLVVQTGNLTSGDGTPGFSLLDNRDEVKAQVKRLLQRPVDEPARTLLLAELYLSKGLRSETVEMLAALPAADQIITVQSLLGETYLNMGLTAEAKAAYGRMFDLAQAGGFIESQAQALTGLALAACASNRDQAQKYWSEAQAIYQASGYSEQAVAVRELKNKTAAECRQSDAGDISN